MLTGTQPRTICGGRRPSSFRDRPRCRLAGIRLRSLSTQRHLHPILNKAQKNVTLPQEYPGSLVALNRILQVVGYPVSWLPESCAVGLLSALLWETAHLASNPNA